MRQRRLWQADRQVERRSRRPGLGRAPSPTPPANSARRPAPPPQGDESRSVTVMPWPAEARRAASRPSATRSALDVMCGTARQLATTLATTASRGAWEGGPRRGGRRGRPAPAPAASRSSIRDAPAGPRAGHRPKVDAVLAGRRPRGRRRERAAVRRRAALRRGERVESRGRGVRRRTGLRSPAPVPPSPGPARRQRPAYRRRGRTIRTTPDAGPATSRWALLRSRSRPRPGPRPPSPSTSSTRSSTRSSSSWSFGNGSSSASTTRAPVGNSRSTSPSTTASAVSAETARHSGPVGIGTSSAATRRRSARRATPKASSWTSPPAQPRSRRCDVPRGRWPGASSRAPGHDGVDVQRCDRGASMTVPDAAERCAAFGRLEGVVDHVLERHDRGVHPRARSAPSRRGSAAARSTSARRPWAEVACFDEQDRVGIAQGVASDRRRRWRSTGMTTLMPGTCRSTISFGQAPRAHPRRGDISPVGRADHATVSLPLVVVCILAAWLTYLVHGDAHEVHDFISGVRWLTASLPFLDAEFDGWRRLDSGSRGPRPGRSARTGRGTRRTRPGAHAAEAPAARRRPGPPRSRG